MDAARSLISGNDSGDNGEPNKGDVPSREEMLKTIESLQKAQKAQSTANDLKSKAMALTDSKQREKILKEAFDKEMESHGHSKMAKRMQSGTWQGLGFGGGIGAATGLGLGAGLGTVLGAVAAVPTTGLGMLVGSGVGAFHGPWVKLGGKEEKFEDADPEKVVDALEQERNNQDTSQLEKGAAAAGNNPADDNEAKPRRKPKKLEIRSPRNTKSGQQVGAVDKSAVNRGISEEAKTKRKPKKLEIRSQRNAESGQHPDTT